MAEPHAHGSAPHDRHRRRARRTAPSYSSLPLRLHGDAGQRPDTTRSRCGRDGIPVYGQNATLRNIAGLGIYTPAWMRANYPGLPAVGRFDSETFEPDKWSPVYDVAPFANRLPDDTFWAARQVMAFSDEDIRAIVSVAQYSDPNAERWIADCLIDRRDRIGRTYFAKVLPLDGIAVRGGELIFTDLAVQHGYAQRRDSYQVDWWTYDNQAGKPLTRIGSINQGPQIPAEAANAPVGSYVLARITAEGVDPGMAVSVYLRNEPDGLRVVGIDREWPGSHAGRSAHRHPAGPKPVRGARPRTAESVRRVHSRVERQTRREPVSRGALSRAQSVRADDVRRDYARAHPFAADRPGRTPARSSPRPGRRLSSRIAGQQAGRGGDQQFRLYVTLRPDARDVLDQSREFERSRENTVYHAGYPHSYRSGAGMPSIQFSLAEDGSDRRHRRRLSRQQGSAVAVQRPSHVIELGRPRGRQRAAARPPLERLRQLVVGCVRHGEVRGSSGGTGRAVRRRPQDRPRPCRPTDPLNASIPDVADAVQEFLTDWVIRRNYQEAARVSARRTSCACVADSMDMDPKASPERLRQAEPPVAGEDRNQWGRPRNLTQAMNPVIPWSPAVRIVEARVRAGLHDRRGADGARRSVRMRRDAAQDVHAVDRAAVRHVLRRRCCRSSVEGRPGGTIVFVWRRVNGEWRLVAYRAVDE